MSIGWAVLPNSAPGGTSSRFQHWRAWFWCCSYSREVDLGSVGERHQRSHSGSVTWQTLREAASARRARLPFHTCWWRGTFVIFVLRIGYGTLFLPDLSRHYSKWWILSHVVFRGLPYTGGPAQWSLVPLSESQLRPDGVWKPMRPESNVSSETGKRNFEPSLIRFPPTVAKSINATQPGT